MPFGKQEAQTWRKEDEIPKFYCLRSTIAGTVKPMMGPATYHGQGCDNDMIIFISEAIYL